MTGPSASVSLNRSRWNFSHLRQKSIRRLGVLELLAIGLADRLDLGQPERPEFLLRRGQASVQQVGRELGPFRQFRLGSLRQRGGRPRILGGLLLQKSLEGVGPESAIESLAEMRRHRPVGAGRVAGISCLPPPQVDAARVPVGGGLRKESFDGGQDLLDVVDLARRVQPCPESLVSQGRWIRLFDVSCDDPPPPA